MHLAIIGGGITGLSAAWELQTRGIPFTILEASNRWGGKVISSRIKLPQGQEFLIEGGPDTLITRKTEAWQLAMELGMADLVTNAGSEMSGTFVLDQGTVHPIPVSPGKFISTPLLTTLGKLRMLTEPLQPARRDGKDESLANFVRRRLGNEALEKFIGPVLGGIYNTNPETQSILISSPVMREMEFEGGSLVKGAVLRAIKNRGKKSKIPRFISFKNGLQTLVAELILQLRGDMRLNSPVLKINSNESEYELELADGSLIRADGVIITTLADQAASLLSAVAPESSMQIKEIRQQNIATLSLIFREADIPPAPYISGLMIPRREKRKIDAITFPSRKMPERGAPGFAVVRVFIGGGAPHLVEAPEQEMLEQVRLELKELLNIQAEPLAWQAFRWPQGFPQAEVGHLDRVDLLESMLPKNLAVAGSSYRGIAVPDCIRQGRAAAARIINHLEGVLK